MYQENDSLFLIYCIYCLCVYVYNWSCLECVMMHLYVASSIYHYNPWCNWDLEIWNVDIKVSAHDAFFRTPLSDTFNSKMLEHHIVLIISLLNTLYFDLLRKTNCQIAFFFKLLSIENESRNWCLASFIYIYLKLYWWYSIIINR